MGWIDVNDRMPPEGLEVLLEVSGLTDAPYSLVWDHGFCIGTWIVPSDRNGKPAEEGHWFLTDANENNYHIIDPTVHAWMPLPRHFAAPEEGFRYNEDLMEHAMFEDDPDWLYKGDAVYEPRQEVREKKRPKKQPEENLEGQMTITEFLQSMEG